MGGRLGRHLFYAGDHEASLGPLIEGVQAQRSHQQRGDYARALEVLGRAERLLAELDDPMTRTAVVGTIGDAHRLRGDLAAARRWADRAEASLERLPRQNCQAALHALHLVFTTADADTVAFDLHCDALDALISHAIVDRDLAQLLETAADHTRAHADPTPTRRALQVARHIWQHLDTTP